MVCACLDAKQSIKYIKHDNIKNNHLALMTNLLCRYDKKIIAV